MKEPRLPPITLCGLRNGGFLKDPVYWWRKECILCEVGGLPFFTIGSLSLLLFSSIVICSASSDNDSSIVWLPRSVRDSLLLNFFILSTECDLKNPASAGAASREQGRRGRRRGKAAPPTPAATGCRSGSQPLADPRRLRRAGLRRRSRLPALAEESEPPGGAAGRSRVAKPPGQHGSRAAESRGRPTNPLGGAGVGARRAGRRRRPAEAAGPDTGSFSLGPPDGAEPTRRSPLRVRRFLTRRLRIDASACFPGESERERKKDFY